MSALLAEHPLHHRAPSHARPQRDAVVLAFPGRRQHAAAARASRLRVTRRGRLLTTLAVVAVLTTCLVVAAPKVASALRPSAPATATTYAVAEGDTLWDIATRIAPGQDPREVVPAIARANALVDADLRVGQVLELPVLD